MIDWEKLAELNNCSRGDLKVRFKKFPKSSKRVIAVCDNCNKDRNIAFVDYGDLCRSCTCRNLGLKNFGENNPMYGRTGDLSPRHGKNHTEESRKKMSMSHEGLLTGDENPAKRSDVRKKISENKTEYWKNPENRKVASERTVKYFEDHPKALVAMLKRSNEYWSDQSNRDKMSEIMKNSDAHREQRGGGDIVNHHMIYDHSDLSKHTISMTRSIHARLHRLFRKHEIEIPHINMEV